MSEPIPVLDHGFIRVVESMGEDSSVVQAARVSYGEGTTTKRGDARLIRYLMRNDHMTPFEMCELKIHVKAPIFVARQWMRHRTASVNEYSGRYSVISEDFYVPSIDQIQYQSESDKQGREGVMSEADAANWKYAMENTSRVNYNVYKQMLDVGMSREIARIILPVNFYTEWYWKIDLRNLLHFIQLRSDSHAQWEIQQYAKVLSDIVEAWVPVSYGAFMETNSDTI